MILPDNIVVSLRDQYMDLKGLSIYSDLGVSTLRDHIRSGKLPAFKVKGKVLVRRSEFDKWIEAHRINRKLNIDKIVNEVMKDLQRN